MVAVHWNLPTCGYDELPETASPVTECDCPRSYGRAGSADLRGYQLDADQDAGRPDLTLWGPGVRPDPLSCSAR